MKKRNKTQIILTACGWWLITFGIINGVFYPITIDKDFVIIIGILIATGVMINILANYDQ